jgi:hypothetical protein
MAFHVRTRRFKLLRNEPESLEAERTTQDSFPSDAWTGEIMDVNPYETPDADAAKEHPTTTRRDAHTRRNLETAVAVTATMLLGGGWAGVRYQGSSFLVALGCPASTILPSPVASRRDVTSSWRTLFLSGKESGRCQRL